MCPAVTQPHTHTSIYIEWIFWVERKNWISTLDIFVYTLKFYRSVCHLNVWVNSAFSVISGALFIVQMIHWRFRLDLKIIFDCMWVGFLCCMLSTKYEHKDEGPLRVQFFGLAQISYTLLSMPSFSTQHHRNTNIHGFDRKERPLSMSSMDNHIHPSIYSTYREIFIFLRSNSTM